MRSDDGTMRRLFDAVLDRSIIFSFDRSGFERHARRFRPADLDVDLHDRIALVTGANSGIGFATAEALAARGAQIWLLCRSRARGEAAQRTIRRRTGNRRVELGVLDVADLAAVRAFAQHFAPPRVDILVHNAGVLPDIRHETADGIELTLATNVIGPFLLTHLLWPRLAAAPAARVILVSSGGMYAQRLNLEDLGWRRREFDGVTAYAQTKRMQVVLNELAAECHGRSPVGFYAMHPGWADTPAVRSSLPRFWAWMRYRLRTPEQGADTVVWLACAPGLQRRSGRFWFDRAPQPTHLVPFTRERGDDRAALWKLCCRLAGFDEATGRTDAPRSRRRGAS